MFGAAVSDSTTLNAKVGFIFWVYIRYIHFFGWNCCVFNFSFQLWDCFYLLDTVRKQKGNVHFEFREK